ncbi:MAG: bifunctional metallophosphatase/5'-nucleotidase [Gammaproteobacteria bacterium]
MKLRKTTLSVLLSSIFLLQCDVGTKILRRPSNLATTPVRIVAFNDFHGQLESPGDFKQTPFGSAEDAIPVGGVDWLAGYIAELKSRHPNTIVVSAGDIIGATPLISALFHDEATIETMNRIGLEFNAVGNHEFDEGKDELRRMQNGGCHPTDQNSCRGAEVGTPVPFEGARFQFLAANVFETQTEKTLFPSFGIKTMDGVRIAFIGMTLKETPSIVRPQGVVGLRFDDEAETANALVSELGKERVNAIVVLIHQGGVMPIDQAASTINACEGNLEAESPIKSIVSRLDDAVDLVVSGHTHQAYVCRLPNRQGRLIPVTSANAQGRVLTDINMTFDKTDGKLLDITAANIVVDRANKAIKPDETAKAIVNNYATIARPLANRVIGHISGNIGRKPDASGESALGDLIADAELQATSGSGAGEAVIAFVNPGATRADLRYPSSNAGEGDGNVTYSEAFDVQPFGNSLVTMTLSGHQLHILLEQQFTGCRIAYPANAPQSGQPVNRILQVSHGFSYAWQEKDTPCDNVDPTSLLLNGIPIAPDRRYRITVNSFLADGGDQFYVLTQGSDRLGGPQEMDALENYFVTHTLVKPNAQSRITRLP